MLLPQLGKDKFSCMFYLCLGLYSNPEVEKSNISNTTQIIIGCSVSMVAVIILVVVVLIWRRRRLGGHAQKQQEPAVVYRNSHVTIVSYIINYAICIMYTHTCYIQVSADAATLLKSMTCMD